MPLFYCVWEDEHGLLVDVADAAAAAKAAAIVVPQKKPAAVVQVAGAVAFRVIFEEDPDDADAELVTIDPLPELVELLGKIEDQVFPPEDDAPAGPSAPPCASEAEDDTGAVVRCARKAGHERHGERHGANGLEW